jgi:hypothetical protein
MSTVDKTKKYRSFNMIGFRVKDLFRSLAARMGQGFKACGITFSVSFGLATPVMAEDATCLVAPTRACVLEMAVDLAERSDNRFRGAHGLLTVAVLREALGLAGSDEAGTRFVAMVLADNPDLAVAVAEFAKHLGTRDFSGCPDPFSDWLSLAPKTMARLAAVIWETGQGLDGDDALTRDQVVATYLGLAGATAELAALVETRSAEERQEVAIWGAGGLLSRRDFAAAGRLAEIVADPAFDIELRQQKIERLIRLKDFPQALTLTDAIEDEADRMSSLADLALRMTWEGVFEAAEVLAARPEMQAAAAADIFFALKLAKVHANLGDRAKVADFTARLRPESSGNPVRDPEVVQIEAITALVSGDDARFLALARAAQGTEARSLVWWSVDAALAAGNRDLDGVMEELPVSLRHTGLSVIAVRLAEAGELDAALATLDRLRALVGPHPDVESDPRFTIAPLLAKRGRGSEAVAMALDLGDAALLASLAVELPE